MLPPMITLLPKAADPARSTVSSHNTKNLPNLLLRPIWTKLISILQPSPKMVELNFLYQRIVLCLPHIITYNYISNLWKFYQTSFVDQDENQSHQPPIVALDVK
jgi:hypothetical protein